LDAFRDRTILMHCGENVLGAIGMPRIVVVERMRLGEEQKQSSHYQEMCSMPHRILLLHRMHLGTHVLRDFKACQVHKRKRPQG
jgi:hypothetical protein